MNLWGKIIGGVLGGMLAGPFGALFGVFIGHQFDDRAGLNWAGLGGDPRQVQKAFFDTTFAVMGHISKADGRVSEREIQMARAVMRHMNLSQSQQDEAIRMFREGKQSSFPLDETMREFRRACHMRRDLFRMFLEIQIQAALADGGISSAERAILNRIGEHLNVGPHEIAQLEALIRAAQYRAQGGAGWGGDTGGGQRQQAPSRGVSLNEAYAVLGVTSDASDAEVKKAYRKL
ncbi:MAG: co-chaperone DjlA, partial [Gammaproteobacteria bacterium]|nr:co-chaperone DjlA [Gammaproteobacteria bacterium]